MKVTGTQKPLITTWANALKTPVFSVPLKLADGLQTRTYVVRLDRTKVQTRLIVFDEPTMLLHWCDEHNVETAIVGGFDLHHTSTLLGDYWINGKQLETEPVAGGWRQKRGALESFADGNLAIGPRGKLSKTPAGDLIQAGPVLVYEGENILKSGVSPEGFSETSFQFTPDPSAGRHPRSAIGYNEDSIWLVVTDGRATGDSGLYLHELAEFMKILGATHALNLDGGSSAQLVRRGKLMNSPRGQQQDFYPEGHPIRTAIYFEPLKA
jgi:hypothetical protein